MLFDFSQLMIHRGCLGYCADYRLPILKVETYRAFLLGLALTLNNLAGGIGGGMAGLNPGLTAAITLVTSLAFFVGGMRIGHNYFAKWIGERASCLGLIAT